MVKCQICRKIPNKKKKYTEYLIKCPCGNCDIFMHESCLQKNISHTKQNKCQICKQKFKQVTVNQYNKSTKFMYSIPDNLNTIQENKEYKYHNLDKIYSGRFSNIKTINIFKWILILSSISLILALLGFGLCFNLKCEDKFQNILNIGIYVLIGIFFLSLLFYFGLSK